jgi:hypothetical protein
VPSTILFRLLLRRRKESKFINYVSVRFHLIKHIAPNRAAQADRMSVDTFYIASRGLVLNNLVGSVNLFPWVHHDTIQRGSPAIRDPRFDQRSNRDLLVRRLFGGAPVR